MYKYSMTQWIVGDEDIEQSFRRLKSCGYDGIEFAAEPYTLDAERLLALMEKYGLSCTSLCGIFPEERDLTASEPEAAEAAVKYVCDSVDLAVRVGAPLMIVVPSPVGRVAPPAGRSIEDIRACAVRNIRRAADYAHSRGVILAIEAINRYETYFANTLEKALSLVEEIDHPAVKLMADLFHMSLEERDIPRSLRMIAKHLVHVHIADNTREAAGLGSTDFRAALRTLMDIGYCGSLTMEFMPRLANPYESGALSTQSELMDVYAKQSIDYMRCVEASLTCAAPERNCQEHE